MRFTRTTVPAVVAKINVDGGRGLTFNVGALPGSTDLFNMFKFYRIDRVEVCYQLVTPMVGATTACPNMWIALDHGSSATPISIDEVVAYSDVSHYQFGASNIEYKRTLKPSPLVASSGQTGIMMTSDTWINTTSLTIPHYGVKEWISNYNTVNTPNTFILYSVRYNITCRGAR